MISIIFLFAVIISVLQYLSYKKVKKVDKKILISVQQSRKFSEILEEMYELSIPSNFDFSERIFELLLDFSFNILEPHFLVFYTYNKEKKSFTPIFDRCTTKVDFLLEISNIDYVLLDLIKSKEIEVFSKHERKNRDIFPLMNYFDSSVLIKNIAIEEDTFGVLVLYSDYDSVYLNIFRLVVDYVANCMRNVKLYRDIKMMSIDTIKTFGKVVDAKSHYTRKHTDRVTEYTEAMLERLDYKKHGIENIEKFKNDVLYASMLHDIGKVGISEDILNKGSALSRQEWDIMCTHPLIGEQIIALVTYFKDIAPLVLYHHEKYDGTGYLYGLKAEEIPVGARILAISDAYDAMTSDRSYRKAMTRIEAIEELSKHSGTHFDPDIVEIFSLYLNEQDTLF